MIPVFGMVTGLLGDSWWVKQCWDMLGLFSDWNDPQLRIKSWPFQQQLWDIDVNWRVWMAFHGVITHINTLQLRVLGGWWRCFSWNLHQRWGCLSAHFISQDESIYSPTKIIGWSCLVFSEDVLGYGLAKKKETSTTRISLKMEN